MEIVLVFTETEGINLTFAPIISIINDCMSSSVILFICPLRTSKKNDIDKLRSFTEDN